MPPGVDYLIKARNVADNPLPGDYQDGDDEEQDKSPSCFFFAAFPVARRNRCADCNGS